MNFLNYLIKYFFRFFCCGILIHKFKNSSVNNIKTILSICAISLISSMIYSIIKINYDSMICLVISIIIYIYSTRKIINTNFLKSIVLVMFSYTICLVIYFISGILVSFISFLIVGNNAANFFDFRVMDMLLLITVIRMCGLKKLKNGVTLFKKEVKINDYINISIIISLFIIIFSIYLWYITGGYYELKYLKYLIFFTFLFLCIFIVFWIKHEMKTYYKHKANEKTIENLLSKVEDQENEIKRLTTVSKISHKTNHQIDVLKSKLIGRNCDDILLELKDLAKEYHNAVEKVNKKKLLHSTKIEKVDEVLEHILNEASKNKIDFVIKINGSINYMVKNYISVETLCTLLSDHLKNSIISINHSKNSFRSITLNIGEIGDYCGIAIHDTGIVFKVNTLVNLGLKATTTHKKDGGTGIGFLTTFETLRNAKGSIIIDEKKPENYNYTKTITFLFDDKNQYRINTYRSKLINEKKKQKIIVTNKRNI